MCLSRRPCTFVAVHAACKYPVSHPEQKSFWCLHDTLSLTFPHPITHSQAAPQDQQAPIEQEQQDQDYGDFSAEPNNFQQQMMPEDDFTAPAADGDGLVEPEAPQEV